MNHAVESGTPDLRVLGVFQLIYTDFHAPSQFLVPLLF